MASTASTSSPLGVLMGPTPLKDKPALLKAAYDSWVTTQPPWVESVASGGFGAFQGAFLGTLMGSMTQMNLEQGAPASE
jgi:hypothetical protein